MTAPLLSYAEAADQVQRYILARIEDNELLMQSGPGTLAAFAKAGPYGSGATHPAQSHGTTERVPLDRALGRVLTEGIRSDRDQPPFSRSTRDGFACRAAEVNTHQFLFQAGQVRAGELTTGTLGIGEVWEIMTGAPVPPGADAVFMVEHAEHSSGFVKLKDPRKVEAGENIVPMGAEARAGDLLLPPGARIGAAQIALAAQCGYAELEVAVRPRVAILSTGDELVGVSEIPGPSQIRNSNSPMLAALVTAAGGEPFVLKAAADNEAAVDESLSAALSSGLQVDLLLITGGISAGRFDLVEDGLTRAGARFFFGGVAIQPGKPVVFGQLPRPAATVGLPLPFFALPGNPISSAVTFHLFAAPVLSALLGDPCPMPRFVLAQMAGAWRGKTGLTRFLPARCDFGLHPTVRLVPWQGSGDIAAFAQSNCFLVTPADVEEIVDGSFVTVLLA